MSSSRPGASGSHGAARPPPGLSDKARVPSRGGKSFLKSALRGACRQRPGLWEGQGGVASGPPVVSTERKVNSERGRGSEREKGWGKGDRDRDRDKETEAEKGETDRRDKDSGDRDGT